MAIDHVSAPSRTIRRRARRRNARNRRENSQSSQNGPPADSSLDVYIFIYFCSLCTFQVTILLSPTVPFVKVPSDIQVKVKFRRNIEEITEFPREPLCFIATSREELDNLTKEMVFGPDIVVCVCPERPSDLVCVLIFLLFSF